MRLFRAVGATELELIAEAGFLCFPPRWKHRPFLCVTANLEAATLIAKERLTEDSLSGHAGFVTAVELPESSLKRFSVSAEQGEFHVPTDELEEFHELIEGRIDIVASFYGSAFQGKVDKRTQLPAEIARILLAIEA